MHYIDGRQIAPTISRQRIAEFFEERARRLHDADFADLIVDGLRPVAALSLSSEVIRLAERVAAADRHIDSKEAQIIALMRLIMMTFLEPKILDSHPKLSGN